MKPQITLVLALLCATSYGQTSRVPSVAKEVTVFISGAQVTRSASVDLRVGEATVAIEGTSPRVVENSIQVETTPPLKMLGVSFRRSEPRTKLNFEDQQRAIERDVERLKKLVASDEALVAIYLEEESMLKANRSIGGSAGVNVNDLKNAVDYYRSRLLELNAKKGEILQRIENNQQQVDRLEKQKAELVPPFEEPKGEILVKVDAKSEGRVIFKVTYLVNEANWMPSYDIKATSINKPISITYKANISQHSGEDWEKVKLTVSSGNPAAIGQRPTIEPWILGFNNYVGGIDGMGNLLQGRVSGLTVSNNTVSGRVLGSDGLPLAGVNVMVKGTTNGTVTGANGDFVIATAGNQSPLVFSFIGLQTQEVDIQGRSNIEVTLQSDVKQLSEVVTGYATSSPIRIRGINTVRSAGVPRIVAATPVVRTTQLEFEIDHPFTIKSGGDMQTVDMVEYEVEAQYSYYCAPRLDVDVFLTAHLTDWEQYNFMEGQANLFFEDKYIGKTVLDTRNTTDTLVVSLGRDPNVVVKREKVKQYSSSQFVGPNRKALFDFEISIRNKKAQPIDLRIEDQLPVANTKEITVEELTISKAVKDDDTGILTWQLKVAPGKTEKRALRYEIRFPKGRRLILE